MGKSQGELVHQSPATEPRDGIWDRGPQMSARKRIPQALWGTVLGGLSWKPDWTLKPWPVYLSRLGVVLQTRSFLIPFLVRARALVVGSAPGQGTYRR